MTRCAECGRELDPQGLADEAYRHIDGRYFCDEFCWMKAKADLETLDEPDPDAGEATPGQEKFWGGVWKRMTRR